MPSIAKFKLVCMFLLAWLAAAVFWGFLLRVYLAHHSESAAAQGLAAVT